MSPTVNSKRDRGDMITVVVRSQDPNGKALLAQAIQRINWTPLYQLPHCNEMVISFYRTLTSLIDYHLPLLTVRRHSTDKPWVTDQFRQLICCRQNARKNGQMARYRSCRNKVNRMASHLRRNYYEKKVSGLREGDPLNWWRSVKQITGLKLKSAQPLSGLANQLHDGDLQKLANNINTSLQQVAADLHPLCASYTPPQTDFIPSEFVIDQTNVEMKLSRINIYKAPGPDGIPNWVLRDFCGQLSGPICAIYNASIREGFVPSCWKEANVIPVPKVHPPRSVESDLRPISLTATLGKLLESFVGAWILERIENQLDGRQYGALRGRSTTHALVDALHHWHSAVDKGQSVRIVFVDYAKAFDHVDHNILVAKLLAFDMPDIIIRWICAFLTDRRQRVKIGDVLSDWLRMTAGMPQRSFLGPLTFIILIDSLRAACLSHKFVDDTTLSEIIDKGAASQMQQFVDELVEGSTRNAMNVNGRKTKEMLIGPICKKPPP